MRMANVEASTAGTQPDWTTRIDKRRLQTSCWVAMIVIALVRAWFTRYQFDADAISYLDIGRAIAERHPGTAVHDYWSPGYPTVLSLFLWLFHPSAYWECPLVHLVNVLIFAGALASSQLFWSEVWLWHANYAAIHGTKIPENAFWALGYSVFAVSNLNLDPVSRVGPDLLLAAFCCLAGWTALRFRRTPSVGRALLLGIMLALGYYAKAPFFPMGFIFLLCACFEWPVSRRMALLAGTALAAFLLICAPFITVLSLARGRLTFGDSALLNHAIYIDGVRPFHWQGGPLGAGTPVHPTRKLNNFPEIYEFAAKDMGTYPPWFDPIYWYDGVIPAFHWSLQAKVFLANVAFEAQVIMESGAQLVCAAIILALLASYRRRWTKGFREFWFMWMPGAMALLMFALVNVEPRRLDGWLILLFAGAISACSLPTNGSTRRAVECLGLAVLITTGAASILQAGQEAIGSNHAFGRSPRNASIAGLLLHNGLKQGDRVAVIGHGPGAYWAHLARLQVVAEIPESNTSRSALDFWESGREQQAKALRILERTGARAVIADPQGSVAVPIPPNVPPPWKKIDGTDAYVYFFQSIP
jgi:hypothetical protein